MASAFPDDDEGPWGVLSAFKNNPCFQRSLVAGLNTSFVGGVAQLLFSGSFKRAKNWAGGGFVVGFGLYFSMCSFRRSVLAQRRAELVREQARRKEDTVRDMFGKDSVESYDLMLRKAREAEDLLLSQEKSKIA